MIPPRERPTPERPLQALDPGTPGGGREPRAQRQHATVLFADLVGFTEMAARLGPERAYRVVTGCLKLLDAVVRKRGGLVDKYLGDALLAIFGYPVPAENSARSAAEAALEMRQRVADYRREVGIDLVLAVHIGINTGFLLAGEVSGTTIHEFTVLGDVVNVAARLKQKAPLGSIYVGADTYENTANAFDYRPLGSMQLKGKDVAIATYELVSPRASFRHGRTDILPTPGRPLVGRRDELRRLEERLSQLGAGRGAIVSVVGAEGVGKSRLVEELRALPAAAAVGFLGARAVAVARALDFHPFADLVRGMAEITEHDDEERSRAKLGTALRRWLPDAADEALAPLSVLTGVTPAAAGGPRARRLEREARPERVAEWLGRLVGSVVAERPLVLVFDDLQWADARSLELLESSFGLAERHAVLFLLVFRDGFPEAIQRMLECLRRQHADRYLEMRLAPLDRADALRLLEGLQGSDEVPPATRELLLERAGGNPARLILGSFLAPALGSEIDRTRAGDERSDETERRRATVLFADLSGFTALTEKLGDEQAYGLVKACLKLLEEVARKYGGTVDKHLGDCVLALFGVPRAIEDAPRAAINAAIEMRRRIGEFNREWRLEQPLDVHIGIHTGLGIAGDISGPLVREFALMGEPVNVASLLADAAPKGEVWVGAEARRFTRNQFEFASLPPIRLQGRDDPVAVYELRSREERVYRPEVGSGRQIFSELVGREEELARARRAVADVVAGRGAILSLSGEAGLGKSRLLAELAATPEARETTWLEGRSLSIGQQLSFHPFADLLRRWAKITDEDAEERVPIKLQAALSRLLPEESDEVLPFVAALMGVRLAESQRERIAGIQGEALERLIRKSTAQLLGAISREKPLVLVFEDLHWADLSSIDLLESLLRLSSGSPILFLHAFRPDFPETSQRVLDFVHQHHVERHVEIRLAPLDPSQTRRLIRNLFREAEIPHATRKLMEEKAGGNPFYLEEVVRSLADEGALEYRDGAFRATERIHAVVIPGTVQEVIMSRVDRLPQRRRQVLQVASVIGQSFHHEILGRIFPEGEALRADLEALQGAEFLVPFDRYQGVEYAFKHPLFQEVTYDSLLQEKRQELHRRVGEAIESVLGRSLPGYHAMLAYHFSLGQDDERAEQALFRAGDEAARSAASNEALHFFREASKLYFQMHGAAGDPAKKALLQKNIALALFNRGRFIEAAESFSRALEFLGERVPRGKLELALRGARTIAAFLIGTYLPAWGGTRPPATDRQREVLSLMFGRAKAQTTASPAHFLFDSLEGLRNLRAVDPRTVEHAGGTYAGVVGIFSYGGISFRISERLLRTSEPLVDRHDAREVFLYRLWSFLHHLLAGSWERAEAIDEALIEENLRCGQLWEVTTYLGLETERELYQGRFAQAAEKLERLAKLEDLYGYDLAQSNRQGVGAFLFLERRELDRAWEAIEEYHAAHGEKLMNLLALSTKVKIECLRGRWESAAAHLTAAEGVAADAGLVPPFHLGHYLQARLRHEVAELELADVRGDARARRRLSKSCARTGRRAAAAAEKVAWRAPEIYRLRGTACWLSGRRRAALHCWERSGAQARRLGMQPELGRTLLEVARRCGADADIASSFLGAPLGSCCERAAAIFEQLDLRWDLERLQAWTRAKRGGDEARPGGPS